MQKAVRGLFYLLIAIAVPIVVLDAARIWSDFVVYHRTANTLLAGSGPLYGPESGLGWPQYFRYPPLFLLLFVPLALLPLPLAAGTWAAMKFVVLYLVVRALRRRFQFPSSGYWWLIPLLAVAPFLIQEFKNGNVQFLVFSLTAAALLTVHRRPALAAPALGLAVILKVWPLFFVPYLVARRNTRVAAVALACVLCLALLPAVVFGWSGNLDLLRQWATQEWGTGSLSTAVWYPSQSLGGVLHTYLSETDKSKWPDANYPDLQVMSVPPPVIKALWISLIGLGYLGLLWAAWTSPAGANWLLDAIAFASLPLIQPFAHRIIFVVLLWPVMLAVTLLSRDLLDTRSKVFVCLALAILILEPLVPGRDAQRFMQIAGIDFLATCLLLTGLILAYRRVMSSES